jgi:hypothetical protein
MAVVGAVRAAKGLPRRGRGRRLAADTGRNYVSKVFDDEWVLANSEATKRTSRGLTASSRRKHEVRRQRIRHARHPRRAGPRFGHGGDHRPDLPDLHLHQEAPGQHKGYEYSRTGNPTRAALEECVAALEGADYGLAFASGLAATTAVMSLLSPGDHVVAGDDLYGGSYRLFDKVLPRTGGLEFTFADTTDPTSVEAALRQRRSCSGSRPQPTRCSPSRT